MIIMVYYHYYSPYYFYSLHNNKTSSFFLSFHDVQNQCFPFCSSTSLGSMFHTDMLAIEFDQFVESIDPATMSLGSNEFIQRTSSNDPVAPALINNLHPGLDLF
ncbi:MAG: hypothetical protein JZU65_08215 [Chlorobium sp.]|nr:hypothetical protein [Chlorobium sp.]